MEPKLELEYHTVMIPITEQFQDEVKKLVDQRWEVLPGTRPVAVYHLVRIKSQASVPPVAGIGGFGSLSIDESKISIIRDGKKVRPDGTVEEDEPKIVDISAKLG